MGSVAASTAADFGEQGRERIAAKQDPANGCQMPGRGRSLVMKENWIAILICGWFCIYSLMYPVRAGSAEQGVYVAGSGGTSDDDWLEEDNVFGNADGLTYTVEQGVADPLEPVNRFFFHFNDKVYFWFLKPLATLYSKAVPVDIRTCIRNGFHNLLAPVRIVNNFLQGKVKNSGIELCRFAVNSTVGIGGLTDLAQSDFHLATSEEDLGQTLGVYGFGPGIYINWPILGPSNIRDTVGLVGDIFLDPLVYMTAGHAYTVAGVYGGKKVNDVSLSLGDYELFKETALDPYAALRDVYHQYRQGLIEDVNSHRGNQAGPPPVSQAPSSGGIGQRWQAAGLAQGAGM